jgi:hypothetical protein
MTQTINFFKKFNIFKNNLKGAITIRELWSGKHCLPKEESKFSRVWFIRGNDHLLN